MQRRTIMMTLTVALAIGCVTGIQLTDKGEGVRHAEATELVGACRLVGDVAIGIPPDAAHASTEEDLIVLMRNKAGQNGGNTVVVDWSEERDGASEEGRHWVGRARAYRCPEPESEADSTGGEAPVEESLEGEGASEGDAEGAEEAEEAGGVSDEDLLAD